MKTYDESDVTSKAGGQSEARAISRGMVAIYKDYVGRGPTDARTSIRDDAVVTVMRDGMTKAEQTLVENQGGATVRDIRRKFQEAMSDEVTKLVEATLQREVVCLLSDHSPSPDYAVEVVILAPEEKTAA